MSPPETFLELCEAQQDKKISNVIGVVIDLLPSTITSKGDHMLTFTLDDGTLQHGQKCRLFCKRKADLPAITGLGDVLILRKVRFTSVGGQYLLTNLFGQPAPWALLPAASPKEPGIFGSASKYLKSNNSPSVTEAESAYVLSLSRTQDRKKFTYLKDEVKEKLTSHSKSQTSLIRDLIMDSYNQIVGEVVKVFHRHGRTTLYITDYTENNMLFDYASQKDHEEHSKLMVQWPGPPGRFTLLVECWQPHSNWLQDNVSAGDFVRLRNVHIKANKGQAGLIEGALHQDKVHCDTIYTSKLKLREVEALILRKEELGWANGFQSQDDADSDRTKKKRKHKVLDKLNRSKKKRRREQEAALKKKEAFEAEAQQTRSEQSQPIATPTTEIREAQRSTNQNIRCEQGDWPEKTIAEIHAASKPLLPNSTGEIMSYATVRVKDFKPANIEEFCQAVEISDREEDGTQQRRSSARNVSESDTDSDHSATSLRNKSTQVRRRKWEWKFVLLLEDASQRSSKKDDEGSNQLIAWLTKSNAEYLLGMKALDLRTNPRSLAQLREKLFLLWGELEEFKEAEAKRKREVEARALEVVSINTASTSSSNPSSSQEKGPVSRPFRCLVEEYGEQLGDRWARKFRIRGTTIMPEGNQNTATKPARSVLDSWNDLDDDAIRIAQPQLSALRAPRAG